MVNTPQQALSMTMWKRSFGVTLVPRPLPILLMLESSVPAPNLEIPKINLDYWRSYEDLEESWSS